MLTSVQISEEDWNFCKNNKLKFSELMREAIFNKKQVISGAIVDNVAAERHKRENFQRVTEKMRDFLEKNQLLEKYIDEEGLK